MTEYARIIVQRHALPLDRHYDTYEWKGDPRWPVQVDWYMQREIDQLPWKLVLIDRYRLMPIYCRTGGWLTFNATYLRAAQTLSRFWRGFKSRLIMTAHVWGIGCTEQAELFEWRNLRRKSPYKW
jgi:hypothetical protein